MLVSSSLYSGVLPANRIPAHDRNVRNCNFSGDTIIHAGNKQTAQIIQIMVNGAVVLNLSFERYDVADIDSGKFQPFNTMAAMQYRTNMISPVYSSDSSIMQRVCPVPTPLC